MRKNREARVRYGREKRVRQLGKKGGAGKAE